MASLIEYTGHELATGIGDRFGEGVLNDQLVVDNCAKRYLLSEA